MTRIITRVTTTGSDQTVSANATKLVALIPEDTSTDVVLLKNGTTTVANFPAGSLIGGTPIPFYGARFGISLVINIAAGAGVVVIWEA